jgi:hypothetical protein
MTLRSIQFSLVFGLSAAFFGCGGSEPAPKPAAPDASTTETAKTPASKTKVLIKSQTMPTKIHANVVTRPVIKTKPSISHLV